MYFCRLLQSNFEKKQYDFFKVHMKKIQLFLFDAFLNKSYVRTQAYELCAMGLP